MKKVFLFSLLSVLFITLLWYFFIMDYDYKVTFETNHPSGVVYNTLVNWNNWEPKSKKMVSIRSKKPFLEVSHDLEVFDSIVEIDWRIQKKTDTITKVTAFFKDKENSLFQKLRIPFFKTAFVNRSILIAKNIREGLKIHKEEYKVSSIEKTIFTKKNVLYTTVSCKLHKKAKTMMKHTSVVMEYIKNNELLLNGDPFLEITDWNLKEDRITFNFCFPISKEDNFPKSDFIKFKSTNEKEALKLVFNGNYSISDRGWYALIDYAERNNIKVDFLPMEVFLNSPHSGGDYLEWEAEIYLPTQKI
ncbi:hypothetical protein [uncultured Maribacter sp.]|uniref:hypothetical protein n=1 Tax=uncultured Maribacter sp. TaxID=431308 RepID=UPI00261F46AE|nr:hypothetical protein [uncultured Maribacter sp.]